MKRTYSQIDEDDDIISDEDIINDDDDIINDDPPVKMRKIVNTFNIIASDDQMNALQIITRPRSKKLIFVQMCQILLFYQMCQILFFNQMCQILFFYQMCHIAINLQQ